MYVTQQKESPTPFYNIQHAMTGPVQVCQMKNAPKTAEEQQCECFIHEQTNLMECKTLSLKNPECIIYITQDVRNVLARFSSDVIDTIMHDGTHYGMKKYTSVHNGTEHEFWTFKKFQVSSQHTKLSDYRTFHPFLTHQKKYGKLFFFKNAIFSILLMAIFILTLVCSVILYSEIISIVAAGVCMFIAGFTFLFTYRLCKKYFYNSVITSFDVEKALTQIRNIPCAMIVTEDTGAIL